MFKKIVVQTENKRELIRITSKIQKIIESVKFHHGLIYLFLPHATAGFWLNEDEEGLKQDGLRFFEKITSGTWQHNQIDNNAQAHLLSGLLKPYLLLSVENGKIQLGTWQEIFLVELDGPRKRKIKIKFIPT